MTDDNVSTSTNDEQQVTPNNGPTTTSPPTNPLPPPSTPPTTPLEKYLPLLIHLISVLIYLLPTITSSRPYYESVLDELHIAANADVKGDTSIADVFQNDYWGRTMHAENSHRSWRPLSILSFRFLKGDGLGLKPMLVHRIVSILIHATISEMISILYLLLHPPSTPTHSLLSRSLAKLLFALHPTHVEAVANAANRPHILAVFFSLLMVDYRVDLLFVAVACIGGLLSSETAIFQLPAVLVTMTVVRWKRSERSVSSLASTLTSLLPRIIMVIFLGASYLVGRHVFDTLSIPEGLIRPAENPFYEFKGVRRFMNYSYVLSIHVGKAFLVDWVGFSHEYGYNCIKEMDGWGDVRLLIPLGILLAVILSLIVCLRRGLDASLTAVMYLSWFMTLFPISGVVKVGTFLADRIVVASTVASTLIMTNVLTAFLLGRGGKSSGSGFDGKSLGKWGMCLGLFVYLGGLVSGRTGEWMSSFSLLESSLRTCPDSAKSNLEISKIYSGMLSDMNIAKPKDLDKAMAYLTKAEEIDPNYCDIHQQIGGINFQRQEYLLFEERLTKSLLCPFTMSGASGTFRQYWGLVTRDPQTGAQAQVRYQRHMKVIQDALKDEKEKMGVKDSKEGAAGEFKFGDEL